MGRVRIGTCSGLAEAALVRSALEARDIPVVINAEQHASMLGGIGGAFVPLHIYVSDEHAEEAAALLRDLRERGEGEAAEGEAAEGEAAADAEDAPAGERGEAGAAAGDTEDALLDAGDSGGVLSIERRRRVGIVLLLSCFIPICGIGHLLTGAWLRGLALAGVQVYMVAELLAHRGDLGVALFGACKIFDIVGALWRIYTGSSRASRLPVARMRLR